MLEGNEYKSEWSMVGDKQDANREPKEKKSPIGQHDIRKMDVFRILPRKDKCFFLKKIITSNIRIKSNGSAYMVSGDSLICLIHFSI